MLCTTLVHTHCSKFYSSETSINMTLFFIFISLLCLINISSFIVNPILKSNSLYATTATTNNEGSLYVRGKKIKVEIISFGPMGASVKTLDETTNSINEDECRLGLILQSQIAWFREVEGVNLMIGDKVNAYIERIREDDGDRLDLSLKEIGMQRIEVVKNLIMDTLEGSPSSTIPIGDKSAPEYISDYLYGVTKTEFKNAIGALYREGRVIPGRQETRLASDEEQEAAQSRLSSSIIGSNGRGRDRPRADADHTCFVGNLPISINEVILENTVVKILGRDKVKGVRIPKRGEAFAQFGYVELSCADAVKEAVHALKGAECMGRRLRTDFVGNKSKREPNSNSR